MKLFATCVRVEEPDQRTYQPTDNQPTSKPNKLLSTPTYVSTSMYVIYMLHCSHRVIQNIWRVKFSGKKVKNRHFFELVPYYKRTVYLCVLKYLVPWKDKLLHPLINDNFFFMLYLNKFYGIVVMFCAQFMNILHEMYTLTSLFILYKVFSTLSRFKRASLNETPQFPFWGLNICVHLDLWDSKKMENINKLKNNISWQKYWYSQNPIRETRVLKLVFITIPCLTFWAQSYPLDKIFLVWEHVCQEKLVMSTIKLIPVQVYNEHLFVDPFIL